MQTTPETVRQVIRSWLAIEVLTPQVTRNGWSGLASEKQGQQRNRDSALGDDPGLWAEPADDDPPPWPLRVEAEPLSDQDVAAAIDGEGGPRRSKPWYLVILGALPAKDAFLQLDAAFAEEADEDETNRRTQGHVIAACTVLDEWGVLVPDSVAIASFAWGLGHMLAGGAASAIGGMGQPRAGPQGALRQHPDSDGCQRHPPVADMARFASRLARNGQGVGPAAPSFGW